MANKLAGPDGEAGPEDAAKPEAKAKAKQPKASAPRKTNLEKALIESINALDGVVSFVNPADGQVISVQAEPLAGALVRLSKQNAAVKRVLESMMVGGAWGEVLSILIIGIALPIAVNHGFEWPWQRSAEIEEPDQPEIIPAGPGDPDTVVDEAFEELRERAMTGEG